MTSTALALTTALATAGAVAAIAAASGGPPPPGGAPAPAHTIVAHGTGTEEVERRGLRRTDQAIERAVRETRAAALPAALASARRDALALAAASGLEVGRLAGIRRDVPPAGWWDQESGAFGPGRWCGRIHLGRRTVRRPDGTTRRVTRFRRGCRPPRTVSVRLLVTYTAAVR